MKQIDCDVIQDLLPSYADKVSSEATNKLVEEHLKTCKKCSMALKNMKKEIDIDIDKNQEQEIDYLRKYKRRDRIKTIIFVITLILDILLGAFIIIGCTNEKVRLFVDVNDVNVEYMYRTEDIKGEDLLKVYLYSEKFKRHYLTGDKYEVIDEEGNKEIRLKVEVEGLFGFPSFGSVAGTGTYASFELDDNVKKISIEDKKGNLKEIWNKDMEVMSADEWKHWYIEEYAPQEVVKKYGLTYDLDLNRGSWYETIFWRYLYEPVK